MNVEQLKKRVLAIKKKKTDQDKPITIYLPIVEPVHQRIVKVLKKTLDKNKMNGEKVEIIGLYKAGKTGYLGLYDGQFKEIYYIKTE